MLESRDSLTVFLVLARNDSEGFTGSVLGRDQREAVCKAVETVKGRYGRRGRVVAVIPYRRVSIPAGLAGEIPELLSAADQLEWISMQLSDLKDQIRLNQMAVDAVRGVIQRLQERHRKHG